MRAPLSVLVAASALCLLSACSGSQSALDPHGLQAQLLSDLIWIFTAVCAAIWLAVMTVLLIGLSRRRSDGNDPLLIDPVRERRAMMVIGGAVAFTLVTVILLTLASFFSQRHLFARETPALSIKVTGHQWWWDVRYENDRPDHMVTSANELYVPVGQPVTLRLAASDVIHSFWVPSLTGKQDLIPGQDNEVQFTAARAGLYRGQCAEFCGWQHAHMGLLVVALPPAEFENWRKGQLAPASPPDDPVRQRGAELFAGKACVMCHTIRGTSAGSRVGPDLTHFASRKSIASATLEMSRGNVAAWVVDPQGIKPGVNMPNVPIAADEIDPLVSYLMGLR